MSIFTDFDSAYSNGYFSEMLDTDMHSDVLHNASVVGEHNAETLTFKDGSLILRSANPAGGQQVFVDGQLVQTAYDNAMGGENIYDGDYGLQEITVPNEHGGIDIYTGNMLGQGFTLPNVYGGEDYFARESNVNYIMDYQDPLIHSNEYVMNPFDLMGGMGNI